jgi:isocitrate dehydrogenase
MYCVRVLLKASIIDNIIEANITDPEEYSIWMQERGSKVLKKVAY